MKKEEPTYNEALEGIRLSIGFFPDDVLRQTAKAMDILIQQRGTSPPSHDWTHQMLTVLGALAKNSNLLARALLTELETTH